MNGYIALKALHIACVTLSIAGFAGRWVLALRGSPLLRQRWLRIVPHVNDTLLLAAAVGLMIGTRQYPFVDGWLTAKIFGLIAYIVLAAVALQPGRSLNARIAAGLAALGVFGWIVSVAINKSAWGIFPAGG